MVFYLIATDRALQTFHDYVQNGIIHYLPSIPAARAQLTQANVLIREAYANALYSQYITPLKRDEEPMQSFKSELCKADER